MTNRRKRINRLKIAIITVMLIFALLPSLTGFLLLLQLKGLEAGLAEVREAVLSRSVAGEEAESLSSGLAGGTRAPSWPEPVSAGGLAGEEAQEEDAGKAKKVYLTFDDGPGPYTHELLDILLEYEAEATFFVTGMYAPRYDGLYRRIVLEGHSLGIHSFSHEYGEIYASLEDFQKDFVKLWDYLYEQTGIEVGIYRFPGGSSNTVSRVSIRQLMDWLEGEGVVFYDWNVSAQDTSEGITAQEIADNCLQGIRAGGEGDTVMILLHDLAGRRATVEALPMILEEIGKMEDVRLLAIDESTAPIQHITITKE